MSDLDELNIVSTKKETDRKCPSCGGVMDFSPSTGGLSCPYCDHTETIPVEEEAPTEAEELDFNTAELTANCNWGVETKTVLCNACSAESIYDSLQTSAVCPFCGSNQVMEARSEQSIAPGGVVPFQISDKDAASRFHKWINKKWFCPKLAKESAKPKSFNGIYLPYWTFDTNAFTEYRAQFGIDHTTHDKDGKSHTTTNWYHTSGEYREFIDDQLVLASKNHNESILYGLEPYTTKDNKSYKPEYVAGFVAERYSIGLKEAWEIAKKSIYNKLTNHITDQVQQKKHADHVKDLHINPIYSDITYKYLLLPVWISNFKYKDKIYQFMVNGQTGKVSGKTPVSALRVALAIFIGIVIVSGLYYLKQNVF
ncbi:MAG TPA: hypothetical protein VJZ04_10360 [Lachnospiraceae bacterium]|nr:hypothetical protein [Lachnospiraceae bacterium]